LFVRLLFCFGDMKRLNLLYLVHRLPYPPDKGDRIRAFHILSYLSRRMKLSLACLADEPVPESAVNALRQYCERIAVVRLGRWSRWLRALSGLLRRRAVTEEAFRSGTLKRILRCWVRETRFDVSLTSSSAMVQYLDLPELSEVPAVIDLVDVDSQKWLDYAATSAGPKAWLYRREGRRLRQLESALPTRARAVTFVSEAEAALYRTYCSPGRVSVITNGVDVDYFRPSTSATEPLCVFVGVLDYHPNVDGIHWFCREVWPLLRQQRPDLRLALVGRTPAPSVRRLAEVPGVEVVGQVPDVRPYVEQAAIAVVPLRIARGVQNKVLEALAMGKATVASPQALAGLKGSRELPVLEASAPIEWIAAITRLLSDKTFRQQLGAAGRRYVEENHRWERRLQGFDSLMGLPASLSSEPLVAGTGPILTANGHSSPHPCLRGRGVGGEGVSS
jgi:sugar transferase (PEP-CTERM/EpsH1 system associated)